MKLHWSDWNRACMSAAVLLALAGLAVFKIPHGFEEGVGWYVCLLPGAIFAAAISDLIQKIIPQSKSIVFDTLLICFNFLWYFVISYLPLKTYRFVSARQEVYITAFPGGGPFSLTRFRGIAPAYHARTGTLYSLHSKRAGSFPYPRLFSSPIT